MKTIEVVCGMIERDDGRYLIGRRPMEKSFGGLLEFPGGQKEAGETKEQCLYREIQKEEFPGMIINVGEFFGESSYREEDLEIKLFGYRCKYISGIFQVKAHIEIAWSYPHEMNQDDFAPADRFFVRRLQNR